MQLAEFDVEISYKQGKLNTNADAITRMSVNDVNIVNLSSELSLETICHEQKREPSLTKLRDVMDGENYSINRNRKLWPFTCKNDEYFIDDDDVLRRQSNDDTAQIVLPPILHKPVLQILHEQPIAGHLGFEKTEARFANQFYWPNIHAKIAEFIQYCYKSANENHRLLTQQHLYNQYKLQGHYNALN